MPQFITEALAHDLDRRRVIFFDPQFPKLIIKNGHLAQALIQVIDIYDMLHLFKQLLEVNPRICRQDIDQCLANNLIYTIIAIVLLDISPGISCIQVIHQTELISHNMEDESEEIFDHWREFLEHNIR